MELMLIFIFITFIFGGLLLTGWTIEDIGNFVKKYLLLIEEEDIEYFHEFLRKPYNRNEFLKARLLCGTVVALIAGFFAGYGMSNTFMILIVILVAFFAGMKYPYFKVKREYNYKIFVIKTKFPTYMKSLEILLQQNTVTNALAKSLKTSPKEFRVPLQNLINKLAAGESGVKPYDEFADEFKLDSMSRMVRMLYRIDSSSEEDKLKLMDEYAKYNSEEMHKARELRYETRLNKINKYGAYILVNIVALVTGSIIIMGITAFASMF